MSFSNSFVFSALAVAQNSAIACLPWIGKGDEIRADQAAVNAMRNALNSLDINAHVVIGEGERDKAPMLYIGEKVGKGNKSLSLDIALDPLEGTTLCAHGARGAMCVLAFAMPGNFLHAPDLYMEKIAIGSGMPENIIDLDDSPKQNLINLAKAKKCDIQDLQVMVLNRKRHEELIAKIREAGARVVLISDGDIAAVIATTSKRSKIDMYMGTGGAPEGVLAAAALRATGGQMMGRLIFANDEDRARANKMGISDFNRKYLTADMAKGEVIFIASGVTDGDLLKGVKKHASSITTNSLIMLSANSSINYITSRNL